MATDESRYAISLTELESSARVPLEEQRTIQPEAPPDDAIAAEKRERLALLAVAGVII